MQNSPRIGIFGRQIKPEDLAFFTSLLQELKDASMPFSFYGPFAQVLQKQNLNIDGDQFLLVEDLKDKIDVMISIGGDGTLLDTIPLIRDSEIPVIGLNLGKLGFLACIDTDQLKDAVSALKTGDYIIDNRSLLNIKSPNISESPFALNDITFFKSDPYAMVNIDVYVDGIFLNSYYGDGLIISTPTGSTAYNLSCGGPILLPNTSNVVLTPIASHTLTVRPLVISNDSEIEVHIGENHVQFHATLDSRKFTLEGKHRFIIGKSDFDIHTIRLKDQHFFDTIRQKLMWGKQQMRRSN